MAKKSITELDILDLARDRKINFAETIKEIISEKHFIRDLKKANKDVENIDKELEGLEFEKEQKEFVDFTKKIDGAISSLVISGLTQLQIMHSLVTNLNKLKSDLVKEEKKLYNKRQMDKYMIIKNQRIQLDIIMVGCKSTFHALKIGNIKLQNELNIKVGGID